MKLCVFILGASNPSILNGTLKNIPSGKHTKYNGKSPCFMGKSTISMAISNSYVGLPGRVSQVHQAIPKTWPKTPKSAAWMIPTESNKVSANSSPAKKKITFGERRRRITFPNSSSMGISDSCPLLMMVYLIMA